MLRLALRDPWLAGAVILGAALRLYGIDHGLPHVYNPDEVNIMARSLAIAQSPDPSYYLYPSLLFYVLFGLMGALYVGGRLVGRYESLEAFQSRFFENPADFYLVGRLFGVVCALATIVLTYHLAAKHFGKNVARLSAFFLAVCFHHVRDAHYIKHDVPAGLILILALIAIDRAMENKTKASYALAGVALGVGFALHYYMIFLAVAMMLSHLATYRSEAAARLVNLLIAAGISAVTFALLSPFVLLRFRVALEHMGANRRVVVDRSMETGTLLPSLPNYLGFAWEQGYGYLWSVLVLIGIIGIAKKGLPSTALWLGFAGPFLVFISYTFFAGRYLNPIVPVIAVAGAYGIDSLARRAGWKLAAALAVVASVQPLYLSVQMGRLFAAEDTRGVASEWVLSNLETGTAIAVQSYSVPLLTSPRALREALSENGALSELERRGKFSNILEIAEKTSTPTFDLTFFGRGDEKDRRYLDYGQFRSDLSVLRARNVGYVILRYPAGPLSPELGSLFELVTREGILVHRSDPFTKATEEATVPHVPPYLDNEDWPAGSHLRHKGPIIEVWQIVPEGSV